MSYIYHMSFSVAVLIIGTGVILLLNIGISLGSMAIWTKLIWRCLKLEINYDVCVQNNKAE